jgi:hypothetical protein
MSIDVIKSVIIAVTMLVAGVAAKGNEAGFTPAEQDLINRGLTMEAYRPNSEVSHEIETIHGAKGSGPVPVFIFGQAQAESARSAGSKLAAAGETATDAERELLQEANAKYPHSPFFVKCFKHEAADAFNNKSK